MSAFTCVYRIMKLIKQNKKNVTFVVCKIRLKKAIFLIYLYDMV